MDQFGVNRSMPMFSVKEDKTFLTYFSLNPDLPFDLDINMGQFIGIKASMIVPDVTREARYGLW
jgi:hypothetical protein